MKGLDRGNTTTKRRIALALMELLDEKAFGEITVTEITDRAGVSRMTYYRNYPSKEAILEERVREISRELQNIVVSLEDTYHSLVSGFHFVRDYSGALQILLKADMGIMLLRVITDHIQATIGEQSRGKYTIPMYAGALYNTYVAWLENGMKESPEEMARLIYEAFSFPEQGET